jgi:type VI secretion system protein VasG
LAAVQLTNRFTPTELDRIAKRMRENRNVSFVYDEALVDSIANRCKEVESGARNIDHILTNTLLPEMSRELLVRMAKGEKFKEVKASLGKEEFVFVIK